MTNEKRTFSNTQDIDVTALDDAAARLDTQTAIDIVMTAINIATENVVAQMQAVGMDSDHLPEFSVTCTWTEKD